MKGDKMNKEQLNDIEELLIEALFESIIECRGCGNRMEPDCEQCPICGTKNPLITHGLI